MPKRLKTHDFDLIIIGSGAGGVAGALVASSYGKKVAIVESDRLGGQYLNHSCIPTQATAENVKILNIYKQAKDRGLAVAKLDAEKIRKIAEFSDQAVRRTEEISGGKALQSAKVNTIKGHAHFIDKQTISVDGSRFSAKFFLIASGGVDYVPPIENIQDSGYVTYREVTDSLQLFKTMVVVGGGATGCEFAYLLNCLGAKVTIIEMAPHLMPYEDKEVGAFLEEYFKHLGIEVLVGSEVFKSEKTKNNKTIYYRQGIKELALETDEIMLATGKRPNVDLGLENATVDYGQSSIRAQNTMQTSAKHIYVAGDVAGPYTNAHMAAYQAKIAVHNMFRRHKLVVKYHAVPRVVYVDPEIATVGMSEDQLQRNGIHYRTTITPLNIIPISRLSNRDAGFVKLLVSTNSVLLGAVIVAPHASEIVHELALAINLGLTTHDVASTVHASPTWSEAIRVACGQA